MDYKIAIAAIVEHNGQILIGKKAVSIGHFLSGQWHIPGGGVQNNETPEQAVVREIKEEAGIDVKVERFLDERLVPPKNAIVKWYLCSPMTHDLRADSDLVEVKYIPKSDVLEICSPRAMSLWPLKVIEYFKSY